MLLGAQAEISALTFGHSDIIEFKNTFLRCFKLGAFLSHSAIVYLIIKVSLIFVRFATFRIRRTQLSILQLNFNSIKKFGNNTK